MSNIKKLITVENGGRPIDDFVCRSGAVVSIDEQQCRDIPEKDALDLKAAYPHLVFRMAIEIDNDSGVVTESTITPLTGEKSETVSFPQEVKYDKIESGAEVFACSVCESTFNSHKGMRVHMGHAHP